MNVHHGGAPKPAAVVGDLDNPPPGFTKYIDRNVWTNWRWDRRDGKWTKPPIKPTGGHARNNDPHTWCLFDNSVAAVRTGRADGIGLMLKGCPELIALDLDDCRNAETGEVSPWASALIDDANSYTEITPSGTGFRIIGTGDISEVHRKFNGLPDGGSLEVYSSCNRYICVTFKRVEDVWPDFGGIAELAETLIENEGFLNVPPRGELDRAGQHNSVSHALLAAPGLTELIQQELPVGQRSERFHHIVGVAKSVGWSLDQLEQEMRRHPSGVAAKYLQPTDRLRTEIERSWRKVDDGVKIIASPSVVTADGEIFEATEDGIALAFAAQFQDRLLFDHTRGKWFEWTGDRWQIDETNLAFDYARDLAREFRKQAHNRSASKIKFSREVEYAARSDRRLVACHEDWDADPFLLGVPGGVVDLRTGDLLPPHPSMMISRQAAVAPEASGTPSPIWDAFLNEATGEDQELICFLQMWCGYCLNGSTDEHALAFVYGPGGNGKSVFINTLSGIMAEYAATAAIDTFTAKRFEGHSTDIAALAGARLVVASETEEGKAWAEARLKQLTGGDRITARFMRQDNFTFRPRFKLTITGNYQPTLQGADPAMQRRLNIVPFTRMPSEPDKQLEEKLRAEWPAILRWMIDGCLLWQEHGLPQPEAVRVATAEYFSEQDLFGQWLEDCCDVEPGNEYKHEASGMLYQSYQDFVKCRGEKPLSSKAWGGQMARRSFSPGNSRSKGGRHYTGICLVAPTPIYNG